jgi:hypothetical protein
LQAEDADLKISALLDGTTIDFLFGTSGMSRGMSAELKILKHFLHELSNQKQLAVIAFYVLVYDALIEYHEKVESCGVMGCCIAPFAKRKLRADIEDAFRPLYRSLYDI